MTDTVTISIIEAALVVDMHVRCRRNALNGIPVDTLVWIIHGTCYFCEVMNLKAEYYQQFDADYSLEVPAEGFGGWKTAQVEINPAKTAVVVMHALDCGPMEDFPGWYRCCDEIPRTAFVLKTVFPKLLAAVRASELSLFHIVGGASYCKDYPGYQRVLELAGPEASLPRVEKDRVYEDLRQFARENSFPGKHNSEDCAAGSKVAKFPSEAEPLGDEGIAATGPQLFALCRDAGVNHIIYAGFNINWCIILSRAGIVEMKQYGLICSAFRQAVTGVENKETARRELGKELGLWTLSVEGGLIFDVDNFVEAVEARSR